MTMSVILDHLLISLLGGGAGIIAGGTVGYLIGAVACALLVPPGLRRTSTLIPWRTIMLGLVMLVWTPNMVLLFGIGVNTGIASTGLVMFLLTLPFTVAVLLDQRFPSSPIVRFVTEIRTLATASFVIAIAAGLNGGGGIGDLVMREYAQLRISTLPLAWLVVVVLILAVDLLLSIVKFSFSKAQA